MNLDDEAEPRWDGMRRVPCPFCDWAYAYDPTTRPNVREYVIEQATRHVVAEHGVAP